MTEVEFKCEACEETFFKAVSDEVATAEFNELFPDHDIAKAAPVCDDCFKRFQEWAAKQPPGTLTP